MQQQIPETVSQVLDVLGEKFGATGAHLWEVMVRQQVIEAWWYATILGLGFALGVFAIIVAFNTDDEALDVASIVIIGFSLIFALIVGSAITTGFFNPEYGALMDILKAVTVK